MIRKALISLAVLVAIPGLAAADTPAGWSVDTSKPKQAIMSYAPEANAPRALIIACMRDSEEFGMYSTGLMDGVKPHGGILTMQLTAGKMKYAVRGEPGIDNASGQPAFSYETNIDSRALSLVRSELFPLLTSKGPLTVKIDKNERQVPLTGIAEPLKKFSAVCFGKS
ncbi:MAG TPA: hypothetical protein VNM46_10900 [Xanthobacteraceae bacterium]|jgi:hypothetical protein|nr:hypothetical protein [Xanthobacteraceae bacterium]